MNILLQVGLSQAGLDAWIMALVTVVFLLILAASGKVQMGFAVPGFPTPLPRTRKRILSKYFGYYQNLTPENKRKFEQKVQQFIYIKDFIPRNIPYVTEEMKVLIAACAVQLTFGYPKIFLSHFQRILIYPDDYYSTINHRYHRGEVNPRLRAIVLSWKYFLDGYVDPTDGRNLGLHEMAHALNLGNRIFNDEYDFFDEDQLDQWYQLANVEIDNINAGNSTFFRDYAGTNQDEFFSVAIEYFFEKPQEFKDVLPDLYAILAVLLKQDPTIN